MLDACVVGNLHADVASAHGLCFVKEMPIRENLFVMTVIQETLHQIVRHYHKCYSQFYYVMQLAASICDRFIEVM